jgi:hypothetical protein
MSKTINWAIGEVLLRETKGKPSDDSERDHRQILEELDEVRNAMLPDYIREEMGGDIPSSILKRVDCVVASRETPVCVCGDCYSRDYLQLPEDVIQLERERGVYRVSYQGTGKAISRFILGEIDLFNDLKFGGPSKKRPGWAKLDDKLYLLGNRFKGHTFIVDYIPRFHVLETKEDYENTWYVPSGLEMMIIDEVVNRGMQQKQMPQDLTNDGKQ